MCILTMASLLQLPNRSQIQSHDSYVHVTALFAFSSHLHRIDFLFKTEIPKQLSLLRHIAFDCLSYNFVIGGCARNIKFSY